MSNSETAAFSRLAAWCEDAIGEIGPDPSEDAEVIVADVAAMAEKIYAALEQEAG